jgi:hypothetical protein
MQVHHTRRRAKEPWVKHSKLKVSLGNHRPRENFRYVDSVECPRIVYTDVNGLWLLAEWHEV